MSGNDQIQALYRNQINVERQSESAYSSAVDNDEMRDGNPADLPAKQAKNPKLIQEQKSPQAPSQSSSDRLSKKHKY